jgi:hypothetical protein
MFLDKFADIQRINKPCKPFHKSLHTLLLESKFYIIKTNIYLTKLQLSNKISNFITIHTYRFPRFILLDSITVYPSLKSTNYKDFCSNFYLFLSPSPSCAQQLLWRLLSSIRTAQSICRPDCMQNDRRSVPDTSTHCNFNFGGLPFHQATHPVAANGHTLLIVKQPRPEDATYLQLAEVTKAWFLQALSL